MSMKANKILFLAFLQLSVISTAENIFKECEFVANGNFVALTEATQEHNCIAYIYCNGEDSFTDICPLGTYFDAASQECVFDDEGRCQYPMPTMIATTTISTSLNITIADNYSTSVNFSTTSTPTSFITSSQPSPNGRPKCTSADADTFFPHALRCEYYYKCIATGYLVIMRCNSDYLWDYERQECMPTKIANCYKQKRQ